MTREALWITEYGHWKHPTPHWDTIAHRVHFMVLTVSCPHLVTSLEPHDNSVTRKRALLNWLTEWLINQSSNQSSMTSRPVVRWLFIYLKVLLSEQPHSIGTSINYHFNLLNIMLPWCMLPWYMLPWYMLPWYMLPSYMLSCYMLPWYMLPWYMLLW